MALRMNVTYWVTCIFFLICHAAQAHAQTSQGSAFLQISGYGKSIDALNEHYNSHWAAKAQLLKDRNEIQQSLKDSESELKAINVLSVVNELQRWENQLALTSIFADANNLFFSAEQGKIQRPQDDTQRYEVAVLTGFRFSTGLTFQGREFQLSAATRSIVERRQKLLMSAQDVVRRAQSWMREEGKLFDQYMDLADVAGTRSRLELRAALRVLEQAEPDNPGARLAKTITLLRLNQTDDVAEPLKDLLNDSPAIRPLALAVQGELQARTGDSAQAKKSMRDAVRLAPDDPVVRTFRAQTLAILNEPEAAIAEWQMLLKSGQHEIAAHRGLAFSCCTVPSSNLRYRKLALEHAKLAHSLSGETEWSCQIALALATASDGDLPSAATLAEAAAENALAERRQQCLEIAGQLKAGQIPAWKF